VSNWNSNNCPSIQFYFTYFYFNRVLRRIFGPKRDEVTGEWRRLHNKEPYALHCSPNIIRVIKSRRLRWTGHVARMGERRGASSSSSLGATALHEPWPPVLFASTGLYPELSFSILQSPSLVGPLERDLAI
jgi:hypothetical protein